MIKGNYSCRNNMQPFRLETLDTLTTKVKLVLIAIA